MIGDVGGRAPGDWHAVKVAATVEEAAVQVGVDSDEVSALLAEMVTRTFHESQNKSIYLVRDTRNLDGKTSAD